MMLYCYAREKPVLYIYPADFVGQTHKVTSYIGYFDSATSQREEPIEFDIEVVSTRPRVFLIKNLLSKFEAEHIIKVSFKSPLLLLSPRFSCRWEWG